MKVQQTAFLLSVDMDKAFPPLKHHSYIYIFGLVLKYALPKADIKSMALNTQ